jgi:ESS family glutamate:Na+ symporter
LDFNWSLFVDLGIISAALLLATFIRAKVTFFQRFLIPNALTAGFILLPLYNFVFPHIGVSSEGLGDLAYHLLALSFIAVALRRSPEQEEKRGKRRFSLAVGILSQYAVQTFFGLVLTFVLMATIFPNLYEPFGFLLPLGFVLGPGQALAIGRGWSAFGIEGAGSVGLTFAALGFILASFGGVYLINYGLRKGWVTKEQLSTMRTKTVTTGIVPRNVKKPEGTRLTTETEAIDSMTFNAAIVMVVYLVAYLFLKLLNILLPMALGDAGSELAINLWGIHFIFAAIIGLLVKRIIGALGVAHVVDNGTLTRLSGWGVDFMVASAIAAISLVVVQQYIGPILILSVVGAAFAFVTLPWIASRLYDEHQFHRMVLLFGVSTGTLTTGLALLRVLDPEFETPVATDYAYASGMVFVFAIPLILSINLPVRSFVTGDPFYFWLAVAVSAGYLLFFFISYLFLARGKAFKRAGEVWLRK